MVPWNSNTITVSASTLTRRVVRRLLELDSALSEVTVWTPAVPVTNVPDPASFLCSLRVLPGRGCPPDDRTGHTTGRVLNRQ